MTKEELLERTKKFALRVMNLTNVLPEKNRGRLVGNQLFRSGTSVAANYRAACRARSTAEFISKLCIVEEEVDESAFWMEMIIESGMIKKDLVEPLLKEARELLAIFIASKKTARKNNEDRK